MKISVDVKGIEATKAYVVGAGKQVRFATAVALTRTAQQVEREIQKDIPATFDRPKPQTTKGTYMKKATPANLTAVAGIKDRIAAYLAPNIGESGRRPRVYKNSEKKYSVGVMSATDFLIQKNNFTQSQSNLIQAKYDYIFKRKILDFYQGKAITF